MVSVDDRDEDVLAALDRIYSENGAGHALAETLRKRVAATSDAGDKIELMQRLGNVLYNDVGNTNEAIDVFRAILEQEPEREDTLRALQNVYLITQSWERLFEVYEKELDVVVGDSAQAEILGRMAMLAWTKLNDLDRAVNLLRRVLDLLGEDAEALNALGNIYAMQENWADLVDVLEREVGVCDDDSQRVKSTPTSAASGTTSCTAIATRSRAGSACSISIPATPTRCSRSPRSIAPRATTPTWSTRCTA